MTYTSDSVPPATSAGEPTLLDDSHTDPLKIIIVGAGIGGLSAALSLRRNGHQVHLFEQSEIAQEIGAAIHLAPNANGVLRRWGVFAEDFGGNLSDHVITYSADGTMMSSVDMRVLNRQWQHPWRMVQRLRLHNKLLDMATSPDGPGEPAILHTSSRVVSVDPKGGSIRLQEGAVMAADLVVGADGIHSKSRKYVGDKDVELYSSGKAAFRFLIQREVVAADPITAPFAQHDNAITMWFYPDRRIVTYPCNDNTALNFVCIHPDEESHATIQTEGSMFLPPAWDTTGSLETMLRVYRNFDPAVRRLLSKVPPSDLKVWRLLDMDKMPTWVNHRLCLLGDAAHPFTPHQGQGAGQAIEDAATLSVVLPKGTPPSAIPERLEVYEKIRYDRAHAIQQYSRLAGKDLVEGQKHYDMQTYMNYNFGHDEIDHATLMFGRWRYQQRPRLYWKAPCAFRPSPSSKLHRGGVVVRGSGQRRDRRVGDGEVVCASVEFKSSRTFLETLFPNERFRFREAATVCVASLCVRVEDDEARLGLYCHGVEYVKADGTNVSGRYVPLVLADLDDGKAAANVRDEGEVLPTVLCNIDVRDEEKGIWGVTVSWNGVTFCEINLLDLETVRSEMGEEDVVVKEWEDGGEEGTLGYKYALRNDNPRKVDEEYAVVAQARKGGRMIELKPKSVSRSKKGEVRFHGLGEGSLPTLHHVASVLSEMPILEVISAKVSSRMAVKKDGCKYQRIEQA